MLHFESNKNFVNSLITQEGIYLPSKLKNQYQSNPLLKNVAYFEEDKNFDPKYKTELCKKFMSTGKCPYGHKCLFAHGKEELISRPQGNNYKKKSCKSFYTKGFCPYGTRCSFKHFEKKFLETNLSFFYFQKFLKDFSGYGTKDEEKVRLPIFNEITKHSQDFQNLGVNSKQANVEHNSSLSTISIDENNCNEKNENKIEESEEKVSDNFSLNLNFSQLINLSKKIGLSSVRRKKSLGFKINSSPLSENEIFTNFEKFDC